MLSTLKKANGVGIEEEGITVDKHILEEVEHIHHLRDTLDCKEDMERAMRRKAID